MELRWSEEEQQFRSELRSFLESVDVGKPPKDHQGRADWARRWMAELFDNGYAGPSYPREFGGMQLSFRSQLIYQEELARARVPGPPGNGVPMAGPTIIKYGTPEQRERFIRPMLRADEVWAQGFSEPGAGSDLPSLRTTARREGDEYIVTGQKVWNSYADLCDWAFVLVRTGAPGSRQNGISYLLIDLSSPGIEIRPLRDITGGTAFCEMFFDDVHVPVANRVGEENEGWRIARTTLGHERSSGALKQAAFYRRKVDEILDLARTIGASKDPVARQRLADADMRVRVMEISAMRMISSIIENGEPGPISSVSRLSNSVFEQKLHELALDLLGRDGLYDGKAATQGGRWAYGYLRTRGSTIGAGTAEIQRNTIAEQVLELPYDPAMPAR